MKVTPFTIEHRNLVGHTIESVLIETFRNDTTALSSNHSVQRVDDTHFLVRFKQGELETDVLVSIRSVR